MFPWRAAAVAVAVTSATSGAPAEGEAVWDLLARGGHVVVVRHASTEPGLGDPPGFRLGDCATQRNLSDAGREEARRLGEALRARGIPVGRVLSSRWCRCLETARLAFGRAEPSPELDSFFDDRSRGPGQTAAVRRLVLRLLPPPHPGPLSRDAGDRAAQPPPSGERPADGNLVLVTHQVNIAALAGISPAPGELVVLSPREDGTFAVAGRLRPERHRTPAEEPRR